MDEHVMVVLSDNKIGGVGLNAIVGSLPASINSLVSFGELTCNAPCLIHDENILQGTSLETQSVVQFLPIVPTCSNWSWVVCCLWKCC